MVLKNQVKKMERKTCHIEIEKETERERGDKEYRAEMGGRKGGKEEKRGGERREVGKERVK